MARWLQGQMLLKILRKNFDGQSETLRSTDLSNAAIFLSPDVLGAIPSIRFAVGIPVAGGGAFFAMCNN